jgi:hypothetical protein
MSQILASLVAVMAAFAASAAEVAVLPVEATNLSEGEAGAIGIVVGNALASEAGQVVALPAETASALTREGGLAPALAALKASWYLKVSAVRLKTRITIHATLLTAEGALVRQAEMTAASLDDVEPVARRLARSLVRGVTVEEARDLHTVTEREGQRPNKVFVGKSLGLKTGMTWPSASAVRFDPDISLQFDARLEGERWFLEFGAGALLPASGAEGNGFGGVFAELGGSVYLLDAGVSPYIGLGVRPALLFALDSGGMNLGFYGQAGVTFMREYRTHFYMEARVTKDAVTFRDSRGIFSGGTVSGAHVSVTEVALQAGMGW